MPTLLKNQGQISPFRGMPVDDKGSSSSITTVTGETVQLYYNSSGTLTSDAGQAAGVVVVGQLAYDNIKNIMGNLEAVKGDTSLGFTCTALTTEVAFDLPNLESLDETSIFNRMATIGATLSNGQYCVDYSNGTIYAKKATTASTMTSTTYKYKSSATSSSGGSTVVAGNVAAGAADSGNPVKVGGKYNSTPPTLTNGQRGDLQMDSAANTAVTLATQIEGEDANLHIMKAVPKGTSTNIVTATTTTCKSGAGILHSITVNKGVATATITVYDNTAGSGTKLATITFGAALLSDPPITAVYDVTFSTGCTVVTSGATDITVSVI